MLKIVSFDFDGTLTKTTFADLFWLEGLPRLYAEKKGIDIEDAKRILFTEYEKIGKERLEWYDPDYWFERFDIGYSWKKLMEDYAYAIEIYPDVIPTLERIRDEYKLIIISNARREFIEIQMKKLRLEKYFDEVFSTVSDFRMVKKDGSVYRKICKRIGIKENEMLHTGDDHKFDYIIPRSLGIHAVYLDRRSGRSENFVINSLDHLPAIIEKIEGDHRDSDNFTD